MKRETLQNSITVGTAFLPLVTIIHANALSIIIKRSLGNTLK